MSGDPKTTTPEFPKLRTEAGGVSEAPPIEEMLERISAKDNWTGQENRYYASGLMQCFRAKWFQDKGLPCDHGLDPNDCHTCRFDVGIAKPGNATEDYIRLLMQDVLNCGKEGAVLNDLRFSHPIEVEWEEEGEDGEFEVVKSTVTIIAKADMTVIGDNMRVLAQYEVKSPVYTFKKALKDVAQHAGTRRVPLTVAGVQEPDNPKGAMSVHQLAQLAFSSHMLALQGNTPKLSILLTISRTNYRDHLEVMLTPEQNEHLFNLAVWWVQEHHLNLQFDEPPAPEYFTSWACKYCNYADRCKKINVANGEERITHPVLEGLNQRLAQAAPFEAPEVE